MKTLVRTALLAFVVGLFAPFTAVAQQTQRNSASTMRDEDDYVLTHSIVSAARIDQLR
jgi:hypothetical protein